MSEVKRWWLRSKYDRNATWYASTIKEYHEGYSSCIEVMRVEDHERIVAELKAEVEETNRILRDVDKQCHQDERTIAKQARVIEKLKNGLDDLIIYVDSDADSFGDRYWPTRNTLIEMLKETTAAERGKA